jgi:Protein of unknown function (DUF1559)
MVHNEWPSSNWARWRANYAINFGNTNYGQSNIGDVVQPANGIAKFGGAPFMPRKSRAIKTITDGTSHTLMMAEVRSIKEFGTTWGGTISEIETALGGQTFEAMLLPNSEKGDFASRVGCINACTEQTPITLDGMDGVPPCTCAGDASTTANQYFAARSKHRGGVNVSCCDASIHFVSDIVDLKVWRALATAAGGENISSSEF